MLIEHTQVFGFGAAVRAMRNPKESWDRSDTEGEQVGPADRALMINLVRAGRSHRKFLRQIIVWVDWTLPIYVWSEVDTYKVATVRNSCSTMHRLGFRDLTEADFQSMLLDDKYGCGVVRADAIDELNRMGRAFRRATDPDHRAGILREMKMVLPAAYLQKATMTFNYETMLSMHADRVHHRLPEWSGALGICAWIRGLPYMQNFIDAST